VKYFYLLSACLLVFLLVGCGPNSSTHSGEKEVNLRLNLDIHNNAGPVYVNPDFGLKYAQGDTTQDTKNSSTQAPITDLKIPIAQGAASAATGAMEAVKNTMDNSLEDSRNDNSATNPTPDIGTGGDTGSTTEEVKPTGKRFALKPLKDNNKVFAWLGRSGADIDQQPLKFSFPECNYTLTVPDSKYNHGANGNASDFNQSYYFSGNPKTQSKKEVNYSCPGGCASVFSPPSPGCKATYVIME